IAEGMPAFAAALTEGACFRLGHWVDCIAPQAGGVVVQGAAGASGFTEVFDQVVVAVPPPAARALGPAPDAFDGFACDRIALRVHRDVSFLPPDRRDWRTVHYTLPADPTAGVATTIRWQRVVPLPEEVLFTWNDPRRPEGLLFESELLRVVPSVADQRFLA